MNHKKAAIHINDAIFEIQVGLSELTPLECDVMLCVIDKLRESRRLIDLLGEGKDAK